MKNVKNIKIEDLNGDIFEIKFEYSHNCDRSFFNIYKNQEIAIGSGNTFEEAFIKLEKLRYTNDI
jgi:hypothetical protein